MNAGFTPAVHVANAIDWAALDALGIKRLTSDSRSVRAGDTFVAYAGERRDGRKYIAQAIDAGAGAVLWDVNDFAWKKSWRVRQLGVRGLRHKIGAIASHVYGRPSSRLWTVGVTGTNGKTTCTQWIAQALGRARPRCAVVGTLGNGFPEHLEAGVNTTPDVTWLHGALRDWYRDGARSVAMEVSSHGLMQGRVVGVEFDVAMLTNVTRDHLDYHGTMANYRRAKARLFAWDSLKWCVFNTDDRFGAVLARRMQRPDLGVLGYGFASCAVRVPSVRGHHLRLGLDGIRFDAATPWGPVHVRSAVLGRFNASNLLGTLAVLLASGIDVREAEKLMSELRPVAGRAQFFGGGRHPLVVVDYAHTPDALEKMLQTLRELRAPAMAKGRAKLVCVFGCGGDRDRGKRAIMGRVASRHADQIIVTSDNPRFEAPLAIIADILEGVTGKHAVVQSRSRAINQALAATRPGDIVLVAGKGHEPYQEIQGVRHRYSDVATVQTALLAYRA